MAASGPQSETKLWLLVRWLSKRRTVVHIAMHTPQLTFKGNGVGHLQRPTYKGTQHFASVDITYFSGHILRASDGNSGVCTDVQ